jgi:hypothetical protein
MADASLEPAVYWRITDNWLELSLRFLVPARGSGRSRTGSAATSSPVWTPPGSGSPSAIYDIVGLPPVQLQAPPEAATGTAAAPRGDRL